MSDITSNTADTISELSLERVAASLEFSERFAEEHTTLDPPYRFNIIDEIQAHEDIHNRLLLKLLSFKEGGQYPLLKSFFEFCFKEILVHKIQSPKFVAKFHHIEALVSDVDYALIIENKIHGAHDQKRQIERYIDEVQKEGYRLEQIYVAYFTRYGGEPNELSLSHEYRQELGKRYRSINYREHLIPWLEGILLAYKMKYSIFTDGLRQYIDHLKGILRIRKESGTIEKSLKDFLLKKLRLENKDYYTRVEKLRTKIEDVQLCLDSLQEMHRDEADRFLDRLIDTLKNEPTIVARIIGDACKIVHQSANVYYAYIPTTFNDVFIVAELIINSQSAHYFGLVCEDKNPERKNQHLLNSIQEHQEEIRDSNSVFKIEPYPNWYYWKIISQNISEDESISRVVRETKEILEKCAQWKR